MNKLTRVIFVLLFLLASFNNSKIVAGRPLVMVSVNTAKAQGRSETIALETKTVPVYDSIRTDEHPVVLANQSKTEGFPCVSLQIMEAGAVCDGHHLDFPEVRMSDVLKGESYLPRRSQVISISEKVVDGVAYRKITLQLLWEPATPEFLQIYLKEYLPYWKNRIPYRLFWNVHYERCTESCSTVNDQGEFLPADIEKLLPALAADVNFNDVPAAFWNQNIKP